MDEHRSNGDHLQMTKTKKDVMATVASQILKKFGGAENFSIRDKKQLESCLLSQVNFIYVNIRFFNTPDFCIIAKRQRDFDGEDRIKFSLTNPALSQEPHLALHTLNNWMKVAKFVNGLERRFGFCGDEPIIKIKQCIPARQRLDRGRID